MKIMGKFNLLLGRDGTVFRGIQMKIAIRANNVEDKLEKRGKRGIVQESNKQRYLK